MLRYTNEMDGFAVSATDGEVGRITDFYFDDAEWRIRYLVVQTGSWLRDKRVLLSPASVSGIDWDGETVSMSLDRKRIESSPDVDAVQPISRLQETKLVQYYGWPRYWIGEPMVGPMAGASVPMEPEPQKREETVEALDKAIESSHIRSLDEVRGYSIGATDGEIGKVDNFILDAETWRIRYLIVDTRRLLPGKSVIISVAWISGVDWAKRDVLVDVGKEQVKNAPEWSPEETVTRDYEVSLHEHYDRPKYWDDSVRQV